MSLDGNKVLVVEADNATAEAWCGALRSAGAEVEHRSRAGKGLEALLLGAVTPRVHDLVVLGPSVARSMRDAFRHTLVGALAGCRLGVVLPEDTAPPRPATDAHGASIARTAPSAALRVAHVALGKEDPGHQGASKAAPAESPPEAVTHSWRVLLVEDNPVNQEVAQAALEQAGMTVHAVFDGQQAVDAVRARTYDAIVMDIQMPVMDGLTATHHIRSMAPPKGQTPIVALTANALPSYRQDAAAAGMNGFVEKPVRASVLVDALRRALRGEPIVASVHSFDFQSETVLDLNVLANLKATFGPALLRVQATLARDAPRRLDRMLAAAQESDFPSLRREAHSLKSSSGTFGLTRVSRLSKTIEMACMEHRHADALGAVQTLSQVLAPDLAKLAAQMD